ncbi:unnamed protein product [Paramecium sonneborni]|uniref:Uncharacterized protein n=1 Tax=Paramecium sonneborni TaxID=65129 RepID=A0A8S1KSH8_9CILI|nr:unnamed protein product [Paramecium sonneborni]
MFIKDVIIAMKQKQRIIKNLMDKFCDAISNSFSTRFYFFTIYQYFCFKISLYYNDSNIDLEF